MEEPALVVKDLGYSPSVSSLLPNVDAEPTLQAESASRAAKQFFDELDDFSLEEEEVVQTEEGDVVPVQLVAEPSLSVRAPSIEVRNN